MGKSRFFLYSFRQFLSSFGTLSGLNSEMMSAKPPTGPASPPVKVGVDGKPTNARYRNMFEEEIILTEKQKLRRDMVENKDKVKEAIKSMTPIDLFLLFDEDDSGLISYEEFRKMMPFLSITISDAKALRYFRLCDTDGSGEIDIDEFRVALFACDPTSGNPVGFRPTSNLTPLDAFELFDEDQSGFLDEDEYYYAMEYLGTGASDEVLEDEFFKADFNLLGIIDYDEFRAIYIKVCDVRKELEDRGVDVPSFIRRNTLEKMLFDLMIAEEDRERKALAEARRYKKWILNIRESKRLMQKAEFRAYYELRSALDAAGHVYVIGTGTFGQFNAPALTKHETKKFKFENFEKIVELWKDRVQPQQLIDRLRAQRRAEEQEEKRDEDRNVSSIGALAREMNKKKLAIDPFAEAQLSPFLGLQVAVNTAALWGKRIYQVAASENVIFALADTGEVFSWGGNSYWWHEIQPDSVYQRQWRGDTTARSQLLMGTKNKTLPPDPSLEQDFNSLSADDQKAEIIKTVAKYFNVWEPPPNPAERMLFLDKDILPKLEYDEIKHSLLCRGKKIEENTKMELIQLLYDDILLEKKLLGEKAHKAIREIETQVLALKKRKKDKLAEKFLKKVDEMWLPLREVQAEARANNIAKQLAKEHEKQVNVAQNYQQWRERIVDRREDMQTKLTPRGNSVDIDIIGTTPRGPAIATPRGYAAALQISAGSAHAGLVHKTGQLYMWGVGISGRLGLDATEGGDAQVDASKPTLLQALAERPVVRISCGFSHTAAIAAGGELFMWGSAATGKCGLGPIVNTTECYVAYPTRVLIGAEDRRVKKVSCGAAHTAVVTETSQLYIFGCGDGGRLGLGPSRYNTVYSPVLVECLLHEKIASVSCGNTTTVVCTEIERAWVGEMEDKHRKLTGGRLYVCGSSNVLGRQIDTFEYIPIGQSDFKKSAGGTKLARIAVPEDEEVEICIKQVSAGFMHTAVVSAEGELYCWGSNRSGCCGQPLVQAFIPKPTAVGFFFTRPTNVGLGKKAYQSSTFNSREAKFAVNGRKEGLGVNKCTCTQQESQPWIEIDLGRMAVIERIVIWNRTDIPQDRDQPRDLFTARLFPCWVMVGRDPFPKSANIISLKEGLRTAVARAKLTEDRRVSTWRCPSNTQGRYVRVQLEKYNSLTVAEIEVYGYWGYSSGVGRCAYVSAGRDVTVAVVRPSHDPRDVETFYKRAAYADAANADILRQMETYVLEYDKFGRGEVFEDVKQCAVCRGVDLCESCILYTTFKNEIRAMPPVVGGRRRRLNSISDYLYNSNKPELEPIVPKKAQRPAKWKIRSDAFFGRFKFVQYFFPKRSTYINPSEALNTDPKELMTTIEYMQKANDDGNGGNSSKRRKRDKKAKELSGKPPLPSIKEQQYQSSVDQNTISEQESLTIEGSMTISQQSSSMVLPMLRGDDNNSALIPIHEEISMDEEGSVGAATIASRNSIGTIDNHKQPHKHGYGKPKVRMEVGDILPTGHVIKGAYPKSIAQQLEMQRKMEEEKAAADKAVGEIRKKNRGRGKILPMNT